MLVKKKKKNINENKFSHDEWLEIVRDRPNIDEYLTLNEYWWHQFFILTSIWCQYKYVLRFSLIKNTNIFAFTSSYTTQKTKNFKTKLLKEWITPGLLCSVCLKQITRVIYTIWVMSKAN